MSWPAAAGRKPHDPQPSTVSAAAKPHRAPASAAIEAGAAATDGGARSRRLFGAGRISAAATKRRSEIAPSAASIVDGSEALSVYRTYASDGSGCIFTIAELASAPYANHTSSPKKRESHHISSAIRHRQKHTAPPLHQGSAPTCQNKRASAAQPKPANYTAVSEGANTRKIVSTKCMPACGSPRRNLTNRRFSVTSSSATPPPRSFAPIQSLA